MGPGPVIEHVELALGLAELVDAPPARALDLGSGAGVPGLVLALHWPSSSWVLLDGSEKRTAVLAEAVVQLGLQARVSVVRSRAEDTAHDPRYRGQFDLVTARSFGPPATTAECGAPFLRVGGALIVSEPPDDTARWPADGLSEFGLALGRARGTRPRAQRLDLLEPCPERYPRRVGVPAKRPVF